MFKRNTPLVVPESDDKRVRFTKGISDASRQFGSDSGHVEDSGVSETEGDEADDICEQSKTRHGYINVDDDAVGRGIKTTVEGAEMTGRFNDDFVADTVIVENIVVLALVRLSSGFDGARRKIFTFGDVR